MKNPIRMNFTNSVRHLTAVTLLAVICLVGMPRTAEAQGAQNDVVLTPIPSGSAIIAMDNTKQGDGGNCSGPLFNLKAYGLVVRLLHNNVPVRWAINTNNTIDDADFSVANSRYTGYPAEAATQSCSNAETTGFAGGPFIIMQPDVAAALPIINAFNAEITDTTPFNVGTAVQNRVRVYITTAAVNDVPIRYTLNHKPYIAVGPDAAQDGEQFTAFRWRVHQRLFDYAKLASNNCTTVNTDTSLTNPNWGMCNNAGYTPYYQPVANDLVTSDSCFTMATQAHAENDAIGNRVRYRQFANSGGNLLFQCRSIEIFENMQSGVQGLFQTSTNWSLINGSPPAIGTNVAQNFPNPWQPFKQFVGGLSPKYGNVGAYYGGTPGPSFSMSVRTNTSGLGGSTPGRYVASVGNIADFNLPAEPDPAVGGHIFEIGGHDYFQLGPGTEGGTPAPNQTGMTIGNLNGQRMILNAVLVPAVREGCSLEIPIVAGFKQVQLSVDNQFTGIIGPNDEATWTIRYINAGDAPVTDFQIVDALNGAQTGGVTAGTFKTGSLTVVGIGDGTLAPINTGYNGDTDQNVLDPNQTRTLGANGGMITVTLTTTLTAYDTLYLNHPVATGENIDEGEPGEVRTDTRDYAHSANSTEQFAERLVSSCPAGDTEAIPAMQGRCYTQTDWHTDNQLDPTGIRTVSGPSAADASIEGRVIETGGRGISGVSVTLVDAATGASRTVNTTSFGYFRFPEVEVGSFYSLSASSKRYDFPSGEMSFTLEDNISGITFVGIPRGSTPPPPPPPTDVKQTIVLLPVKEEVKGKEKVRKKTVGSKLK